MVYYTRRFVLCLTLCHFVFVFFSPFSIAITSLGEEIANLNAFSYVCSICACLDLSPLPLGVWEGLRYVIVALPGLFSYLLFFKQKLVLFYTRQSERQLYPPPQNDNGAASKFKAQTGGLQL